MTRAEEPSEHEFLEGLRQEDKFPELVADAEALAEKERVWAERHLAEQRAANRMVEKAEAKAEALAEALERLASQEGFDGAGYIDPASFAWRELSLRGKFAADALARYRGESGEGSS